MADYQSGLNSQTNQNSTTGTNAQASTVNSGLTDPYAQQALQNSIQRTQATAAGPNYYASIGPMQTAQENGYQTRAASGLAGLAGYQPQQATAGTLNGANLSGYMNPYVSSVVKSQVALENQQDAQQQQQLQGNAAMAGAFGGNRATLAQSSLAGQQALANNATNSGLYSAGYTQAQNTAEADLNRNLSAQQGNQFAGLQAAGLNLAANQGLAGLGSTVNQLNQNQDTAAYQAQINAAQLPYQQNQYQTDNLNSLLRYAGTTGTTANSGNTSSSSNGASAGVNSQPEPSGTSQVLGAGLGLAGLGANTLGSQALSGLGNSLWNGVSGLFGSSTPSDTYDEATDLGVLTVARGGRIGQMRAGLTDYGDGRLGYARGGLVRLADGGSTDDDDSDETYAPIGPGVDAVIDRLRGEANPNLYAAYDDTAPVAGLGGLAASGDPRPDQAGAVNPPAMRAGLSAVPPAPGGAYLPPASPAPGGLGGLASVAAAGPIAAPAASPAVPQQTGIGGLAGFLAGAQLASGDSQQNAGLGGLAAASPQQNAPPPAGGSGWGDSLLRAGLAIMGGSSPFALQNIGQGGLAGLQSADQARELNSKVALQNEQLRGAKMTNDFNQMALPQRMNAFGQAFGGQQAGLSSGASGTSGGLAGGNVPAAAVNADGTTTPLAGIPQGATAMPPSSDGTAEAATRQLLAQQRYYALSGQDRAASTVGQQLLNIAGPGGVIGPDGRVYKVPGAYDTRFSASQADEAGKVGPQAQLAGIEANIRSAHVGPDAYNASQATLPADATRAAIDANAAIKKWGQTEGLKPTQMMVPDGKGGFINQNMTLNQAASTLAGPSATPITDPASALATVPTTFRTPFVNALVKNGIPPSAWPVAVAMAGQESSWNPNNPGGLGNVLPDTAKGEGFDPTKLNDPNVGLDAMMHHYALTLKQAGGDPIQAGILYNNGGDPTKGDPNYGASLVARLNGATRGIGSGPVAPGGGAMPGISGTPFYSPEQTKIAEAYGDVAKNIINAGQKAPVALQRLDVIDNASEGFRPGASGGARLAAAKGMTDALQSLGIDPPNWLKNGAAAGETINKEGGFLATELTRSLGSREALGVFNAVKGIMPNIELSNGGFQVVTNSIRQGVLRDQDLANYQEKWLAPKSQGGMGNGSIAGMEAQFEKDHPVQAYASRITPYPMPKSATGAIPNVIYATTRGPALWDGQKFTMVN